ncbi:MAG: J domain-containing protein [Pseudomonadota bacterium]
MADRLQLNVPPARLPERPHVASDQRRGLDPDTVSPAAPQRLLKVLFEFESQPGRYAVGRREPAILFLRSRDVLALAAARPVAGLTISHADVQRVQRAACYFVRSALFRPQADHYTLLGLAPGFTEDALRDHYRLLMRLVHPDFAGPSSQWPADAATRINRAHDVLASAVELAAYEKARAPKEVRRLQRPTLGAAMARPLPKGGSRARNRIWALAAGSCSLLLLWSLWRAESPEALAEFRHEAPAANALAAGPGLPSASASADSVEATAGASSLLVQQALQAKASNVRPLPQEADASEPVIASAVAERPAAPHSLQPLPLPLPLPRPALSAAAPPTSKSTPTIAAAPQIAKSRVTESLVSSADNLPAVNPAPAGARAALPSVMDAQLLLTHVINGMQSGRGEEILSGLDRSLRHSPGAVELAGAYDKLVDGSRGVTLGQVQLQGTPQADQLTVDGVVQLIVQTPGQPARTRELRLRAGFVQRNGQAVMTSLGQGGRP